MPIRALLLDIFETTLDLDGLRRTFVSEGYSASECDLFFTSTLRDGMALTLAGRQVSFPAVADAALLAMPGVTSPDVRQRLLAGFRECRTHPDVASALRTAEDAGVPVFAFTHGSSEVARVCLHASGVLGAFAGVLSSTESLGMFKPAARVYQWGCEQAGAAPGSTALVAAHAWDTDGAQACGLRTGFVERLHPAPGSGAPAQPAVMAVPDVSGQRLDSVLDALLTAERT